MSQCIMLAYFDHQDDVLRATAELRRQGVQVLDVYSPHAIHGIDEAMGLRPSRLPWVCFAGGLIGVVTALWFQHWANAVSWPINVGGKPWNSLPAEVPVAFEMLVLLAAFASVAACLAVCRLFPGKRRYWVAPGVTDDQYAIALAGSAVVHHPRLEELLQSLEARSIERHIVEAR